LFWADLLFDVFPGRFRSEIEAELDRMPVGWLSEVLEARAYRQAKSMREAAEQSSNPSEAIKALPQTRIFGLVAEIDYRLANGGDDGRV
jgi:hypothetical protein